MQETTHSFAQKYTKKHYLAQLSVGNRHYRSTFRHRRALFVDLIPPPDRRNLTVALVEEERVGGELIGSLSFSLLLKMVPKVFFLPPSVALLQAPPFFHNQPPSQPTSLSVSAFQSGVSPPSPPPPSFLRGSEVKEDKGAFLALLKILGEIRCVCFPKNKKVWDQSWFSSFPLSSASPPLPLLV